MKKVQIDLPITMIADTLELMAKDTPDPVGGRVFMMRLAAKRLRQDDALMNRVIEFFESVPWGGFNMEEFKVCETLVDDLKEATWWGAGK